MIVHARTWMPVLLVALTLAACDRRAGPDDGEAHPLVVTAWGDRHEVFAEIDVLVAGRSSTSHTHVTELDGFAPLAGGVVTVVLSGPEGDEQTFRSARPVRDGIFSIEIEPARPGRFALAFRVAVAGEVETIAAGAVSVGAGDSLGHVLEPPPYGPTGAATPPEGEPIDFLKEEQWRTSFATAWATTGAVHDAIRAPARLRPAAGGEALLAAPLDGVVAPQTRAFVGMDVGEGAAVAWLRPRVGSERSLEAIRAELELAEARLGRLEELLRLEAASAAEVEAARARVRTLTAESQAVTGGGPAMAVPSPFAGRVAEVLVVPGEAVAAGSPLARIVRTRPLWLEVAMRPEDAARLGGGIRALTLRPAGDRAPIVLAAREARLISRAPEVSRATGAVTTIFEIARELPLGPGIALEAEVLLPGASEGVVVPASAVVDDGGVPVVYVQTEGEQFVRREIRVAAAQADSVAVEGLEPGGRIVTRGGAAIRRAALLRTGSAHGHVH